MAPRIVDPSRFLLFASVTDWNVLHRRNAQHDVSPRRHYQERGLRTARIVQLRWVLDPALGYPTQPFTVWRRRAGAAPEEEPISYYTQDFLGQTMVVLDRPRVFVRAWVSGSGSVTPYAGVPYSSPMLLPQVVTAGQSQCTFSGPAIQTLLLSTGVSLQKLSGLDGQAAADSGWEPLEIVGLPVDSTFDQVQRLDAPQGLVSALTDPVSAALDRFRRGAPFFGWPMNLAPGVAAPAWQLADPKAMLRVVTESMLPELRQMVELRPEQQAGFTTTHALPAVGGGSSAVATISPLRTLAYGAATDPLASLITGFGTAYEDTDDDDEARTGQHDFMVSAWFEDGTNGVPSPVDYAAIVFAPGPAPTPPTPSGVAAALDGLRSPPSTDDDWIGVTRISWDRLGDALPLRVGSYALARAQVAPAGAVEALMDPRPYDTALQPIGASTSDALAGSGKMTGLDDRYHVASDPNPNQVDYGVAHQDLFGVWSDWGTAGFSIGEPPVGLASLITARWDATPAPVPAACAGDLTIDLAWNWANRSPVTIDIVGRLYAQGSIGAAPADLSVPGTLATGLGNAGTSPVSLLFSTSGEVSVLAPAGITASVAYFSDDSTTLWANLPAGPVAGPRRYRLHLSGFSLDFASTGVIGMALWARGTEVRSPGRVGDWGATPLVASAPDPRPPVLDVEHEAVQLTSLANAHGEYDALLEWPAAVGAVGYFAYTCSETALRNAAGLGDWPAGLTLSERLVQLRAAFATHPNRQTFTRVNATPVAGTRLAVTLPRGTKDIHLYLVLGLSAGQIESAWPTAADPLLRKRPFAFAAPHIVRPHPPTIEVTRRTVGSPAAFEAAFRLGVSAGVRVGRLDLYRVRVPEAAIDLDSMGPPVARITGPSGSVVVTPTVSTLPGRDQPLAQVEGLDAVGGSWKPVYYRAVAWAADDVTRGQYGGRSEPSTLRQVVIPPATGPVLTPPTWSTPTVGSPVVQVQTMTTAPAAPTSLGPHRVQAEVLVTHADGTSEALYRYPAAPGLDALNLVPATAPAAGTGGLWLQGAGLHLQVARAAFTDALTVRFRLTDPLGRMTESDLLTVPATSPVAPPDISNAQVLSIAGRGRLLTFETAVPDEVVGVGPYQVRIDLATFQPPPQRAVHRHVQVGLADIAAAGVGADAFTDSADVPLRQAPMAGGRSIAAVLHAAGRLTVQVIAPDGTQATIHRTVV